MPGLIPLSLPISLNSTISCSNHHHFLPLPDSPLPLPGLDALCPISVPISSVLALYLRGRTWKPYIAGSMHPAETLSRGL